MIDSINKIVSNVSNNVVQENIASSNISSGASNRMIFKDIGGCRNITFSNIKQTASSTGISSTQSKQTSINTIATNITNDIYKDVNFSTETNYDELNSNKELDAFLDKNQDIPKPICTKETNFETKKNLTGISTSLKLVGLNSTLGKTRYKAIPKTESEKCYDVNFDVNEEIKKTFELDNSFKINEEENVENNISNSISQKNISSCIASSSADNYALYEKMYCEGGDFNFNNNEQLAISSVVANCMFDQTNINQISTSIINKIKKKYDSVYDAIYNKANNSPGMSPNEANEYYDKYTQLLDLLGAAEAEKYIAASNNIASSPSTIEQPLSQPLSQDQIQNKLQDQNKLQNQDQPQDKLQAQIQDQLQAQLQNQDQPQDKLQAQKQDQTQTANNEDKVDNEDNAANEDNADKKELIKGLNNTILYVLIGIVGFCFVMSILLIIAKTLF